MATKAQHEYAVYLFQQGHYADTISQLDEILRVDETAERWSDWATAQYGLNQLAEAERGFRRALELDPDLSEAAMNFGMLLSSQKRWGEAVEMFESALPKIAGETRSAVESLIAQCAAQMRSTGAPIQAQTTRQEGGLKQGDEIDLDAHVLG
jgi:Tfp pilus assembly protein PilF